MVNYGIGCGLTGGIGGGIVMLLVLALLGLAFAALIKYLRS